MPVVVPFQPGNPSYRMAVTLGTADFLMDVTWNDRDGNPTGAANGAGAWYMDLYLPDETPIAGGIKIVLGTFLGLRVADVRMPHGLLQAVDTSATNANGTATADPSAGVDAGLDDLGARVIVRFWSLAELQALGLA